MNDIIPQNASGCFIETINSEITRELNMMPLLGFLKHRFQWCRGDLQPKSLERSPAVGDFYGTRIEIWAGFGPVRQLLRPVFHVFMGKKKF